jgi:hypothetical protein
VNGEARAAWDNNDIFDLAGCIYDRHAELGHTDLDDDGPGQAERTEDELEHLRCLDDEMELDREAREKP